MDARLFRYLFENTSNAIVMTGCIWDKYAQEQTRYAYSCEMSHNNWGLNRCGGTKRMLHGAGTLDLFVMGSFSMEDIERLMKAVRHGGVDTVVIPYVTPIQRFIVMQTMKTRGMEKHDPDVLEFVKEPYLYLQHSSVKRFYFLYGNGKPFEKMDEVIYPGHHFECQDEEILAVIEEMEGYRIPVMKAGYIIDNRMLFYFGYFGTDLHMIRHFIHHYTKNELTEKFDERHLQKMTLFYRKELGDPGMDSLTMFCSPMEVIATQTDCVLNTIVIDQEDFCHADIEGDEGRCTLKCMLYNDYDVCRCHRTEKAQLRAGVLLLGNMKLNKHMKELKYRYRNVQEQIRAITLPNCGHKSSWDSELLEQDARKNAVFWICPLQAQTPDQVLREIKSKNARYRVIGLNEEYGCCFNGFLTEKM